MRMARHGESGRIVVNVPPELKRRIYWALSLSGDTLKDWSIKIAEELCDGKVKPVPVENVRYTRGARSAPAALKEDYQPTNQVIQSKGDDGKPAKKFTVVSMFSGCGGMDLGFMGGFEVFGRRYRSLAFEIVWANDINAVACKIYERNLGHSIHRGDIWELMASMPKKADVVIGGFSREATSTKWISCKPINWR